jgi:CheY-like chemotaxis protein
VGGRDRVLVVEDDKASRFFASATLLGEGFIIDEASSAEQALKIIRERRPDLILVDIELPGIDGLELTRRLKSEPSTAAIPVIAITAHAEALHRHAALAAGCETFLAKPVSPVALVAEVRNHLAGSRQA